MLNELTVWTILKSFHDDDDDDGDVNLIRNKKKTWLKRHDKQVNEWVNEWMKVRKNGHFKKKKNVKHNEMKNKNEKKIVIIEFEM